jgi:hypothetical protein
MDMTELIDNRQYKRAAQRVQNDFDGLYKACKYAYLLQESEWKQPINN